MVEQAGRLAGKVALITGGASGIGEAAGRRFVAEGARVLLADVQDERGAQVAKELGDGALYLHTDVREEAQVEAAVERALSEFGQLDCMFANAGIVGAVGPIDEMPADEWDFTMSVNLRGVFLCMKHAARVMKPRQTGTILSTSSIAGVMGGLGPHAYAAAKCALRGLTSNIAAELCSFGIRVNCIAPGNMATGMTAGLAFNDTGAEGVGKMEAALAHGSPLPGRPGFADDIARAAVYLASDDAGYVNGHTLLVDAGLTTGSGGAMSLFKEYSPMIREGNKRGLPTD